MTISNDSLIWAKNHKKSFVLNLVTSCRALSEGEPAGIFMAGLPGAGKTELSKSIIEDSGVKLLRIDMDEIAKALPGYEPGQADSFRKPATLLLSEVFGYALKKKISFIMDGTFGNAKARENIERSLKHSFLAKIVYVFQDPKLAWRFTVAREKIEYRAIKFDGFIEAYYKTIDNIKLIGEEFGDRITLDIAIKNPDNKVGRWERNVKMSEIDKILTIEYNKDKLIQYIKGA